MPLLVLYQQKMLSVFIVKDFLLFNLSNQFFVKYLQATILLTLRFFIVFWGVNAFTFSLSQVRIFVGLLIFVLISIGIVAFYTLLERKGIAAVQRREGPNVTGPYGLLQPIADGLKLILKELDSADDTQAEAFDTAPILSFTISYAC
jgi:hypothetical protein